MDSKKFNRNLILLIKIFNKHPNMFISFLNKNNAFTDVFKKKISRASIKQKPSFADIDEMLEYYLHILDEQEINTSDKCKAWNAKLYDAISEQRFEDAAKIRDYMNKKNYKIFI